MDKPYYSLQEFLEHSIDPWIEDNVHLTNYLYSFNFTIYNSFSCIMLAFWECLILYIHSYVGTEIFGLWKWLGASVNGSIVIVLCVLYDVFYISQAILLLGIGGNEYECMYVCSGTTQCDKKSQTLRSPAHGIKGRQLGCTRDGMLPKWDTAVLRHAHGYSPGVVDA